MGKYDDVAVYDIPFSEVEQTVADWASEALELRHGAAGDPKGKLVQAGMFDGSYELADLLLRARQRSDRVDELLAKCTQARARAKRAQSQAQFSAELAYDEATRNNATRRTAEFVSREERKADAALDSLEQRRIAHFAERLVSVTAEAYEVVNQIHWQLESMRKDIRATMHALQFESSLER
jgi:vacuolar-type H+-ATPase subunit I/STV1